MIDLIHSIHSMFVKKLGNVVPTRASKSKDRTNDVLLRSPNPLDTNGDLAL